ncbi:TetR/AcrR family transcriptional regulator (plasmid) [Tistrella bauzanensis]
MYRSMQNNARPTSGEPAPAARGRGRPRAFDRDTALAEATRLFWAKGYEATSMADLTKAMGIGSPSLYAAFGSKDALYAEALDYYARVWQPLFWKRCQSAATAREAIQWLLEDLAAVLGGAYGDIPGGCMVALSSVTGEGHEHLDALVRSARAVGLDLLKARFARAVAEGEIPATVDIHALARFVQTVQNGMSILARDGASRAELEAVARIAMAGFDAQVGADQGTGGR